MKRALIALAALAVLACTSSAQTTQTFANPYYTQVVCHTDGTFQNGEFDFLAYDSKGVAHFYKFFAYAPSNLNRETPQMAVTEDGKVVMPLTDGTWSPNYPAYGFEAGTLPGATVDFTIQPVRGGFRAVNVTATLTR